MSLPARAARGVRAAAVLACFVTASAASLAGCSPALPPGAAVPDAAGPKKAYEILLEAERFESARVGVSGTDSPNAIALGVLVGSPEGKPAFDALLARATTAGKLYALAGLYFVDPGAFEGEARRLARMPGEVSTIDGCIGGSGRGHEDGDTRTDCRRVGRDVRVAG